MIPAGCVLLCVSALSLNYYRYDGVPRIAEAPKWEITQGIALELEIKAMNLSRFIGFPLYAYWANRVHGDMDTSQFRLVGWQFEAGVRFWRVEFYRGHHSQHILEDSHPWMRFPVQDTMGVRLLLLGDGLK